MDQTHKTQKVLDAEYCISIRLLNGISQKTELQIPLHHANNFVLQLRCKMRFINTSSFWPILIPCYMYIFSINSPSPRHHLLVNQVIYSVLW